MAAAAVSVGAERERMIFLRAVPPSAPLMPLSAIKPSIVSSSSTPPDNDFAVPPTVSIASPSWATLVFDFCDVFASLSLKPSRSLICSPRADMESVIRSDA